MDNIQKELNEIKELLQNQKIQQKEILTVEEASVYLQISRSCLYKKTSNKEIPFYQPGMKKIYFKRSDLDNWVFSNKVPSYDESLEKTENYLGRNSNGLSSTTKKT